MNGGVYAVLKRAILGRQQVSLNHHGYQREVCPHVLGLNKDGEPQVLVFQFAGGSSRGLPPGGQWRCLLVSDITAAGAHPGPWHTGHSHLKPQTCVAEIDVEV